MKHVNNNDKSLNKFEYGTFSQRRRTLFRNSKIGAHFSSHVRECPLKKSDAVTLWDTKLIKVTTG